MVMAFENRDSYVTGANQTPLSSISFSSVALPLFSVLAFYIHAVCSRWSIKEPYPVIKLFESDEEITRRNNREFAVEPPDQLVARVSG
jgi:hypothetical protein